MDDTGPTVQDLHRQARDEHAHIENITEQKRRVTVTYLRLLEEEGLISPRHGPTVRDTPAP